MLPFPFFLVSFAVTFLLCPLVRCLAIRMGALDMPGGRHVHTSPTPRLGGLAIAAALAVSLLLAGADEGLDAALLLGGGIIVCLGIQDDTRGLPPLWKLAWQTAAALFAVFGGVRFHGIGVFSVPVTLLWLLLATNAFNLIDGLDALCGGCGAIAGGGFALLGLLTGGSSVTSVSLSLSGACLGFLPHNMRQKKLFLGDTGAQLIGFVIGVIAVPLVNSGEGLSVAAILLYPLSETATSILRRLRQRKSPFLADRGHFHHRLTDCGIPPRRTVWLLLLPSFFMGLLGVVHAVSPWMVIPTSAVSFVAVTVLWRCEVAPQGTKG